MIAPLEITDHCDIPALLEAKWMLRNSRARRYRTMRDFAEEEIILPSGPYRGRRFKCDRQPYAGLFFDLVDSGHFRRHAAVGPVQSGKTLNCCVIPAMYYLFEREEDIVYGVPDGNMARDKWLQDLLPVIKKSRYGELLPTSGAGSKGGSKLESVTFKNGVTLRFMGGGSRDASRSGYTARVIIVTEVDKMDVSSTTSREADPLYQMEARSMSFDDRVIFLECTASIEQGRIWQEYKKGTNSIIMCLCPYCENYVSLEREDFKGWDKAKNVAEAREAGTFVCPSCESAWDRADQRQANLDAVVVHDGQEVNSKGKVKGEIPPVDTLGFRWSAVNNLFVPPEDIAATEHKALSAANEESAEKNLRQFFWALPHISDKTARTPLELLQLRERKHSLIRGVCPPSTDSIVVAVDVNKHWLHWGVGAVLPDLSIRVIDYGVKETLAETRGTKQGIYKSLKEMVDDFSPGWKVKGKRETKPFDYFLIDSGWQTQTIYRFIRDTGHENGFFPIKGFGTTGKNKMNGRYNQPKKVDGKKVLWVGDCSDVSLITTSKVFLMNINADLSKEMVHANLSCPSEEHGAITWFASDLPSQHMRISKHMLSEEQVDEYVPNKGFVTKWVQVSKNNHFLDVMHIMNAGSQFALARR